MRHERSRLAMTGSELDLHEALTALERALRCDDLAQRARRALSDAVAELRLELARGPQRPPVR